MATEVRIRSLAQAILWRVLSIMLTFTISWIITKSLKLATAIGLTDAMAKFVLYYFHERIWAHITWGSKQ